MLWWAVTGTHEGKPHSGEKCYSVTVEDWRLAPPEAPFSDWSSAWCWTDPPGPTPWSCSTPPVRTALPQTRQAQIYDLPLHAAAVVMPSLFPWHPFGWTQDSSCLLNTVLSLLAILLSFPPPSDLTKGPPYHLLRMPSSVPLLLKFSYMGLIYAPHAWIHYKNVVFILWSLCPSFLISIIFMPHLHLI